MHSTNYNLVTRSTTIYCLSNFQKIFASETLNCIFPNRNFTRLWMEVTILYRIEFIVVWTRAREGEKLPSWQWVRACFARHVCWDVPERERREGLLLIRTLPGSSWDLSGGDVPWRCDDARCCFEWRIGGRRGKVRESLDDVGGCEHGDWFHSRRSARRMDISASCLICLKNLFLYRRDPVQS